MGLSFLVFFFMLRLPFFFVFSERLFILAVTNGHHWHLLYIFLFISTFLLLGRNAFRLGVRVQLVFIWIGKGFFFRLFLFCGKLRHTYIRSRILCMVWGRWERRSADTWYFDTGWKYWDLERRQTTSIDIWYYDIG